MLCTPYTGSSLTSVSVVRGVTVGVLRMDFLGVMVLLFTVLTGSLETGAF